jgi:hypothetical protein
MYQTLKQNVPLNQYLERLERDDGRMKIKQHYCNKQLHKCK